MSAVIVLALRLALAVVLYGFLGWALITVWRDVQQTSVRLSTRKVPPIGLTLKHIQGASQRSFQQSEIMLGRDPASDVLLNDETVSARHARLSYHHGQWWLEDLGSMNGTRLNEARLTTPTVVTDGDRIECGQAAIQVSLGTQVIVEPTVRLP
jgi:pSer/pThr/pTyr-binding forkhead associated (FHA) protein